MQMTFSGLAIGAAHVLVAVFPQLARRHEARDNVAAPVGPERGVDVTERLGQVAQLPLVVVHGRAFASDLSYPGQSHRSTLLVIGPDAPAATASMVEPVVTSRRQRRLALGARHQARSNRSLASATSSAS